MQRSTFFSQFLKKNKEVGSIAPSSSFLASSISKKIKLKKETVVVELGAGTGSLTKRILSVLGQNDRLFCIELNQIFLDRLSYKMRDPRLNLIKGSAEQLLEHLGKLGLMGVDCIISSLPLSNIASENKHNILSACQKALGASGQFIQYQYSLQDKKFVQQYFSNFKLDFVLINIPPAFVYHCSN